MPHSHRGKLLSENPRHHQPHQDVKGESAKSKSPGKDETKGQIVKDNGGPNGQLPVEQPQPWSHWIPGDDGRWFYQGRLKADGSGWEYQFTDGYPSASRRPVVNNPYYPAVLQKAAYLTTNTNSPVFVEEHRSAPIEAVDGDDTEDVAGQDEVDEEELTTFEAAMPIPPQTDSTGAYGQLQMVITSPVQPPARKKGQGGNRIPETGQRGSVARKKKLGTIVKAEKELRINSRKRVKKWLSTVDP